VSAPPTEPPRTCRTHSSFRPNDLPYPDVQTTTHPDEQATSHPDERLVFPNERRPLPFLTIEGLSLPRRVSYLP